MRKLGFNMLFFCVIALVLYMMDVVSGKIILYVLVPILLLFMLVTALQTYKVYKRLLEELKQSR
ncbi:putative membrane protein [Kurthia sp. 11kri321]|nr:putative membrane protein [Kurthia sp. 11kri321]